MLALFVTPSVSLSHHAGQGPVMPAVAVSMVQSAVVPGWGEFRLGNLRRGRIFAQAELVLWVTLIQAGEAGKQYDARLRSFGSLHAGVSFSGKDDQFVTDVGNYASLDAFNQAQQRLRQPGRVYRDPENSWWSWDSEANRRTYRRFRVRRDTARKIGRFVIGGMILNRIVSIIDVTYLHRIHSPSSSLRLYPVLDPQYGVVGLGASVRF
ncbi:MAG: hypothetical protein ACE5HZ_09650 [Fidelibacterota bacterium]